MKLRTSFLSFIFSFISFAAIAQLDFSKIEEIIQNEVKRKDFSGTVLIADKGKAIYQKSFGIKDIEFNLPIELDTKFGIASVTKMLTAIIIMELVEEKKFYLRSSLSELLPDLELPQASKITIHHLLLHISGLPNEPDSIYAKFISPLEYVKQLIKNEQELNNFETFNYANIDYVLLGLIIEKTTNKTWQSVVSERIISKLGLENTGFLVKGAYPENFAFPYSKMKNGELKKEPAFHIENFYAAGAMYSTAEDLLKIDQAMYDNEFITEQSRTLMFKSYPEYNYSGYSVWTYNYPFAPNQPKIMERRGGIKNSTAVLVRMLDTNKTIIILCNNGSFNPDSFGDVTSLKEALMIELASQ